MCYADSCEHCGQEYNHAEPHATSADCIDALFKREYHAIRQHEDEIARIHRAREFVQRQQAAGQR